MISLELNGEILELGGYSFLTFEDIISSVREERSPDEVISSAWFNGSPVSAQDLERCPKKEEGVLSINTREKKEYVSERLSAAQRYVVQISESFRQSIHAFKTGHAGYGNTFLARGVDELLSFVAWYSTIINLETESSTEIRVERFYNIVRSLQLSCEKLISAQLLESSFAISTALENELIPKLSELNSCCLEIASTNP